MLKTPHTEAEELVPTGDELVGRQMVGGSPEAVGQDHCSWLVRQTNQPATRHRHCLVSKTNQPAEGRQMNANHIYDVNAKAVAAVLHTNSRMMMLQLDK